MPPCAMSSSFSLDSHCSKSSRFAHANAHVIESDVPLVERFGAPVRKLVETDQGLADRPYNVAEWSGVLVEDRFGVEEPFVPWDAATQVGDGQRNVRDRRKVSHASLPFLS